MNYLYSILVEFQGSTREISFWYIYIACLQPVLSWQNNPFFGFCVSLVSKNPYDLGSQIRFRILPKKRTLNIQFMRWSEICYLSIHCLFCKAKKQIYYRVYRAEICENVPSKFEALFDGVGEPIKCTCSPPFGICDWQAEHLSLSHIGSFRVYLSSIPLWFRWSVWRAQFKVKVLKGKVANRVETIDAR